MKMKLKQMKLTDLDILLMMKEGKFGKFRNY